MKAFRLFTITYVFLALALGNGLQAQVLEEKTKPDQLNIIKVNITQLAINEARLLYELQVRKTSSFEFGAGYIYPNRLLYNRGGSTMLTSGFSLYAGFRKYFDKKRYIYQPAFRSYTSFVLFSKFNHFEDEWLLFGSGDLDIGYQCERFSRRLQQYGAVMRFGFQTRAGRLVMDMYSGIGLKVVPSLSTSTALNDCTRVCSPIASTQYRTISSRDTEVEVVINAGIQLGLRGKNRDKIYKEATKEEDPDIQDSPPKF